MPIESWTQSDIRFMKRAINLAKKGFGSVEPNPLVGAVLAKNNKLLASGYHEHFGGPHAEINALRSAAQKKIDVRGSTLYVTLEPCCHWGKTPPCCDAIIEAGIKTVIIAYKDPFTKVSGKGIAKLKKAGITVKLGLLLDEASALNRWFNTLHTRKTTWVICKWAQTLDGKLAAYSGHSKWITGESARRHVHHIRTSVQAIVIGIETAIKDDPELTVRIPKYHRKPNRVVFDSHLRIDPNLKLVKTAHNIPTWVITSSKSSAAKRKKLVSLGVNVITLPIVKNHELNLKSFLSFAFKQGWSRIMVEGGARLLSSFLNSHLADELNVYISPKLAMDSSAIQLTGFAKTKANQFIDNYQLDSIERFAPDIYLRFRKNGQNRKDGQE